MSFINHILLTACAVAALCFHGCASIDDTKKNNEFVMGVVLPISGENAEASSEVIRGMMLARDEINAKGGVAGKRLRLIIADASSTDFSMNEAVQKMKTEGARYFHLGFTNEIAFPIKKLGEDSEIFINAVCEYPPATLSGNNIVRVFANGAQTGDVIEKFVKRPDGEDVRFVSLKVEDLFGKSCGNYLAFEMKRERTKFFADVFTSREKKFDLLAEQILRVSPLCVFYTGYGHELPSFCRSLYARKYVGMIVANTPIIELGDIQSSNAAPLYVVRPIFEKGEIHSDESVSFVNAFKRVNGRLPRWTAAYGYDGVKLLSEAAKSANFEPSKTRQYFDGRAFEGAIGKLQFDESGDCLSQVDVYRQ